MLLSTSQTLRLLAACISATVMIHSEVRSEGLLYVDANASATAGQNHNEQKGESVPPLSVVASASDHEDAACLPGVFGSPGFADGESNVAMVADHSVLRATLQATGFLQPSLGPGCSDVNVSPITSSLHISSSETGPVYETIAYKGFGEAFYHGQPIDPFAFAESLIPGTASGQAQMLSKSYELTFEPQHSGDYGREMLIYWSVGAAAGSSMAPFGPVNEQGDSQSFEQPTPGDAAAEGGVRYQAPHVDRAILSGFDLTGADLNPFTAFRFPDVPPGADHHFALKLGDTEIAGLAGETVNLRQYASNGFTALSLRGDLTPFLPAAAAPDAAVPIGGPPPQLAFGLAFAQPGIASFTLKPVPEPSSLLLAVLGGALVLLAQRRGLGYPSAGDAMCVFAVGRRRCSSERDTVEDHRV